MNFQEYMQLEIESNVKEKVITFNSIVKLDGEYEVTLLDIMYVYIPFSLGNLAVDRNIVKNEKLNMGFTISIPEERIVG